jgi:dihydropteroate synthase
VTLTWPAAVSETDSLVVVTYNRGKADAARSICADDMAVFRGKLCELADAHGIPREHLILDPGVGFGKTYEQNFGVLANLDVLVETGDRFWSAFHASPSSGA